MRHVYRLDANAPLFGPGLFYREHTFEPLELPDIHAETLYRVAQEALHNVLKHAEAENVWIRLERVPGGVRLSLDDDGKGLDEEPAQGLGLRSMASRAELLRGSLKLVPRAKGGLRVEVEVPHP